MKLFVLWDLVHLVDKQSSDNPKHETRNQLHDNTVEPEVDREGGVLVEPRGLMLNSKVRVLLSHEYARNTSNSYNGWYPVADVFEVM